MKPKQSTLKKTKRNSKVQDLMSKMKTKLYIYIYN